MKKKIIGRTDVVNFPDLHLYGLSVKIDTGAYTSSIHCVEIEEITEKNKSFISFRLLDPLHEQYHKKYFKVEEYSRRVIKNSFGESEERYVILTTIVLFGKLYPIDLTLTNRGNMKFPVLLGRKILDNFLVDSTKKNLSFTHSLIHQR